MTGPDSGSGQRSASPFIAPVPAPIEPETARVEYARRLASRTEGIPALNRLADLAARLTGAGSAQVSIISDVQTVMGGTGDAAASVGGQSPAPDSLCTVTVEAQTPVVVPDAPHDPRVSALPPVSSGVVGAYLGVPLVAGGHTVGALCVFDRAAREWDERDVALLEQLVGPVLAELELAALEASYEDDKLLWQLAVDAAGVGVFDWDLTHDVLRWDERLLELFGLRRETFGGNIGAFNECVHPDDRARVTQALTTAIETCGAYGAEYRVVLPTGDVRWITARGHALAGPDDTATRVLGAAFDTTAVRDGEARVARVLEAMPTAFFHLDQEWRFTYVNAEAARHLTMVGAPVVGQVVWELFPATVGSEFETNVRAAVATGLPVEFEGHFPAPLDGWYELRAWPTPDGLSVYFVDVSARHEAEAQVQRTTRRAELLAEVTRSLTATLDTEEAVARLARLVVPVLGDWCIVTLVEGDWPTEEIGGRGRWRHRLRDIGSWHHDPGVRSVVHRYAEVRIEAMTDGSLLARSLDRNERVVVARGASPAIAGVLQPGEARELVLELDAGAAAIVPLRGRGRTVGLLTICRDTDRGAFSPEDIDTLDDLAGRAGLALDTARTYAVQRDLAEGLQRSLLTAPPRLDHLEIAVRYTPSAEAAQVGGDWYDAFLLPDGSTTVVIGDVVGHDVVAAASMGQVRSVLRGIAVATDGAPASVLTGVDRAMATLRIDTIATAVVARFEQSPAERAAGVARLRWSNAGHPPPLVVDPSGAQTLWTSDLLLGMDPDAQRGDADLTLPRGATVLLYSDGLVERRGRTLDEGVEILGAVLAELVAEGVGLEELCDRVLGRMLPARPEDDVAIAAVRLRVPG